jgi:hypothetical protein
MQSILTRITIMKSNYSLTELHRIKCLGDHIPLSNLYTRILVDLVGQTKPLIPAEVIDFANEDAGEHCDTKGVEGILVNGTLVVQTLVEMGTVDKVRVKDHSVAGKVCGLVATVGG